MAIRKIHLDPLSSITIVWNRGSRIGRVSPSNFDRLINIWRRRYVKKKVRLRYILKNSLFFTAKNCQPLALSRRIFFFFLPYVHLRHFQTKISPSLSTKEITVPRFSKSEREIFVRREEEKEEKEKERKNRKHSRIKRSEHSRSNKRTLVRYRFFRLFCREFEHKPGR